MIEGHSETEDLDNEQRQHLRELLDHALSDQTKDRGEILEALIQDHPQVSTQLRAEFDKIELIRNARQKARDADPAAPTSRRDDTQSQPLPSDADLRASRQFGRYRVLRLLGSGGFGNVYHGFDEELERFVAIKVPRSDRLTDEAYVEDILREAKLAAQLRHSAIVAVFDVGRDERGVPFIVQDFIDGQSLTYVLRHDSPMVSDIAGYLAEVAEGLAHAHRRGILHRDLKPSNILIDTNHHAHVADFGLAVQEGVLSTKVPPLAGTIPYMSPEQLSGVQELDARSDIWALGIVLYECLTGRRPFAGCSLAEASDAIERTTIAPPSALVRDIPVSFDRICLQCLSRDTDGRYASAQDVADALRMANPNARSHSRKSARSSLASSPLTRRLLIGSAAGGLGLAALSLWLRDNWLAHVPTDLRPLIRALMRANTGYDGTVRTQLLDDDTWSLDFTNARALVSLQPVRGFPISKVNLRGTGITGLEDLHGLSLTYLDISETSVIDLEPIRETQLTELFLYDTAVSDISAIRDLPLDSLGLGNTKVEDISPLAGMLTLESLEIQETLVTDISPLRSVVNLGLLDCAGTPVKDYSALESLRVIEDLYIDEQAAANNLKILAALPQLRSINEEPAEQFLRKLMDRE